MKTGTKSIFVALLGLLISTHCIGAENDTNHSQSWLEQTLAVNGRGEVGAAPDLALVRMGAMAQAETAGVAQQQVNEIVQKVLKKIKALGIADKEIQTVGLNLFPVYKQERNPEEMATPKIIGYRARNVVQVRLRDIKRLGEVIDAGITSGANELEGVSFQLDNDLNARREALQRAAEEARVKAEAIAQAMRVKITGISEIKEGDLNVVRPMEMARVATFASDASTPIQPGEVRIEASLLVRYRFSQMDAK